MRIKRGTVKHRRHKKVLKAAKGYRMTFSRLFRRAKEAVMHAGVYSFNHRRHRRGQLRTQWIKSISAALAHEGMSYNEFISGLKTSGVTINRKYLAEMAVDKPEMFKEVVKSIKK